MLVSPCCSASVELDDGHYVCCHCGESLSPTQLVDKSGDREDSNLIEDVADIMYTGGYLDEYFE